MSNEQPFQLGDIVIVSSFAGVTMLVQKIEQDPLTNEWRFLNYHDEPDAWRRCAEYVKL